MIFDAAFCPERYLFSVFSSTDALRLDDSRHDERSRRVRALLARRAFERAPARVDGGAFATQRCGRSTIPQTSPRFDARGDARMRVDARERASVCVASYLAVVLLVSARSRRAFLGKFGRRHRISGGAHLCVLTLYCAHAVRARLDRWTR